MLTKKMIKELNRLKGNILDAELKVLEAKKELNDYKSLIVEQDELFINDVKKSNMNVKYDEWKKELQHNLTH